MDISKFDLNHIEFLASAYLQAEVVFGVEPEQTLPRTKKKIRKWINRTQLKDVSFKKNLLKCIDDTVSDDDFIAFLLECNKYIEEKGTWKHQLFEKVAVDFDDDVKKAFIYLFEEREFCDDIQQQPGSITFVLNEDNAFRWKLILQTSLQTNLPRGVFFDFSNARINKADNGYTLICEITDYENEESCPLVIPFHSATVESELFSAAEQEFFDSPWETLSLMANDILGKNAIGSHCFNEKEQELIPLLKELKALMFCGFNEVDVVDFSILRSYFQKYELNHLLVLMEKVLLEEPASHKYVQRLAKLVNALNQAKCEPLWREVHQKIVQSQQGYQVKTCACDSDQLTQIRCQIEQYFYELGYQGEYPNFHKVGPMKGIHLAHNYNLTYFVGAEKKVEYIIKCTEKVYGGRLHIQFLCGTAIMKNNETVFDIYSCCFNKRGRRLFKTLDWQEENLNVLQQFVKVAAKKAECLKLTKREKECCNINRFSWWEFFWIFVVTGGLFAVFMTLAMFVICCIVTAVTVGFGDIPEMIREMPWWLLFLIGFIGFGGAMGCIEAQARRK